MNKQETLEGLISEYHSIAYEKLIKGLTEQETTADYIDRHIVEAMVEVAKQKIHSDVFKWLSDKDYLSDKVDIIQKEFEQFINK
jgi:DNA-directed RNA polymerase specialized sigma54-like protein